MSETITATTSASSSQTSTRASSAASEDALGYTDFLTLLVSQVRNQDPLDPLDSTQYVSQLAEFSALEQQLATNETLETINSTLQGDDVQSAVNWIGREVSVEGAASPYEGGPIDFTVEPPEGAEVAEVQVRNSAGGVVARFEIDPTDTSFAWNGLADTGGEAAIGNYGASVRYKADGVTIGSRSAVGYVGVTEVRISDGGVKLVLTDGQEVDVSAVEGVR